MALNCSAEGPGPMAARGWDKETPPPFCDVQHGAVAGALDPSENVPGPRSGGVHNFSRGVGVNWEAGLPESWGEGGEPLTELYSGPRPFNLWRLFPPPPQPRFLWKLLGNFFSRHQSRLDLLIPITWFLYSPVFSSNFDFLHSHHFFLNRRIFLG